jgi:hypothetical protein
MNQAVRAKKTLRKLPIIDEGFRGTRLAPGLGRQPDPAR